MNQHRIFEHITRNVLKRLTLNEEDSRVTAIKRDVIRPAFINNGFEEANIDTDKLYNNLRGFLELRKNSDLPLIKFIAPIAYSDDVKFDIDDTKREEQEKLREIAHILRGKNNKLFDDIKNEQLTFAKLCEIVEPHIEKKKQQEDEELSNVDFVGDGDYDIIEDIDYDTAKRYGRHSCSKGRICYTEEEYTWNRFKDNGKNKCYLLLRKGWENVKEKHTEPLYDFLPYDAYDEYGLSMVFVFVKPNNEIAYCNTRWNHHADYGKKRCDHALNSGELEKLTGKVFGGYTEEEGFVLATIETAHELLDKGYDPKKILDEVSDFNEGFAKVRLDDMWNYINEEDKLISKQWFHRIEGFEDGVAKVELNDKYNFINTNGELLSEQWFDKVWRFEDGFAMVKSNDVYNFINREGKLISEEWFYSAWDFQYGFARVRLNGKFNFINTEGELFSDNGFDYANDFYEGSASVKLDGKYYKIDRKGNLTLNAIMNK